MKSFFVCLIITCLLTQLAYANKVSELDEINTPENFYKNPSFVAFSKILSTTRYDLDLTNKSFPIHVVFIQQVFRKHPDYISQLELENISDNTKFAVYFALKSINHQHDIVKRIECPLLSSKAVEKFIIPINWEEKKVSKIIDLDFFWAAFFATGNKRYIEKIMYAVPPDTLAFEYGLELYKRYRLNEIAAGEGIDFGIKSLLEEAKNKGPKFFNDVCITSSALFSIRANYRQDPVIMAYVDEFIRENPPLSVYLKGDESEWLKERCVIVRN